MKDIEIILIDARQKDNTIIELKKYKKKEKRIRLNINKIKRKILYSKSIAKLNAKGQYIIQQDKDDIFDILYKES